MEILLNDEYPLTCGTCKHTPATHVIVVYFTVAMLRRRVDLVCTTCGNYTIRLASPQVASISMHHIVVGDATPTGMNRD